jgi:hypothetical protein
VNQADEMKALAEVQSRLQQQFPHVAAEVVEAAVQVAHSGLTGPIRDFVPLLVEHAARDRLALAGLDDAPTGAQPEPDARSVV